MFLAGAQIWSMKGFASRRDFWNVAIKSYAIKLLIALPILLIPSVRHSSLRVSFCELDGIDRMALLLGVATYIFGEVLIIPVSVRRLREIGHSGYWIFMFYVIMAIPFVGQLMPIVRLMALGCLTPRIEIEIPDGSHGRERNRDEVHA